MSNEKDLQLAKEGILNLFMRTIFRRKIKDGDTCRLTATEIRQALTAAHVPRYLFDDEVSGRNEYSDVHNSFRSSRETVEAALESLVEEEVITKRVSGVKTEYFYTVAKTLPDKINLSGDQGLMIAGKWTKIANQTRIHLLNDGVTLKPDKKSGWEIE